jgi:diguanylate cyclase (GGDEF)-like protein/PAS domain S-box-containing protein
MPQKADPPRDMASDYEELVEFLYLTPVGIIKFRPDGTIVMANPHATQLLMPLSDDMDMSDLYRLLGRAMPDLRARIEAFRAPVGQICDQIQMRVPDTHSVLTLGINKIDPDTLMAVVQDITRAIEQESRIFDDQQRFRAIFENVRDYAIFTVDLEGRLDDWNRSLNRLGGWDEEDVVGAVVNVFFPLAKAGEPYGSALLERAHRYGTAEFEGWGVRKNGSIYWGNTVATALPDREGHPTGYVLVTRDLTERKQMEDRLLTLSTSDPLTGASNRRGGEARLSEAFQQWLRHRRVFSLLMIDADHFKAVNDKWGHEAGDAVLCSIVRACESDLREADLIIRWGGEEFLMLLPDTDAEGAFVIADRLRVAIEAGTTEVGTGQVSVTVSIGAAVVGGSDVNVHDLVNRADHALYDAKHGGRNRVVVDGAPRQPH